MNMVLANPSNGTSLAAVTKSLDSLRRAQTCSAIRWRLGCTFSALVDVQQPGAIEEQCARTQNETNDFDSCDDVDKYNVDVD